MEIFEWLPGFFTPGVKSFLMVVGVLHQRVSDGLSASGRRGLSKRRRVLPLAINQQYTILFLLCRRGGILRFDLQQGAHPGRTRIAVGPGPVEAFGAPRQGNADPGIFVHCGLFDNLSGLWDWNAVWTLASDRGTPQFLLSGRRVDQNSPALARTMELFHLHSSPVRGDSVSASHHVGLGCLVHRFALFLRPRGAPYPTL